MAWEWVAPVVTGVIGIAGIAGTLSATQLQRKAQIELHDRQRVHDVMDKRRGDRIALYARIISSANELVTQSQIVALRRDLQKKDEFSTLMPLNHTLGVIAGEISLVASDNVAKTAHKLRLAAQDVMLGLDKLVSDEDVLARNQNYNAARHEFIAAARLDLAAHESL